MVGIQLDMSSLSACWKNKWMLLSPTVIKTTMTTILKHDADNQALPEQYNGDDADNPSDDRDALGEMEEDGIGEELADERQNDNHAPKCVLSLLHLCFPKSAPNSFGMVNRSISGTHMFIRKME